MPWKPPCWWRRRSRKASPGSRLPAAAAVKGSDLARSVMIIAGEASGDMYGAKLVEEAHRLDSSVRFFGIGGQAMRAAGVETLVDSREMAVMGFVEGVAHFGVIYRAFRMMEELLQQEKPDR